MIPPFKPIVLVILDGWGESPVSFGNAIVQAKLPTIEKLNAYYPKLLLQASGISVGLSWGEEGNSEVGHQTLGAGRIIYQDSPRIDLAIEEGNFFKNPAFLDAINWTRKNHSTLHLIGLVSDGGVHSHINHLEALLELAKEQSVEKVFIHAITDGRDTPPRKAVYFIKKLLNKTNELQIGKIASLTGRYYAMDRNNNYDRTEKAFAAMVSSRAIPASQPLIAIQTQYQAGLGDEYLKPTVLVDQQQNPVGNIHDGDALIFFNFRKDRMRQLVKAFALPHFNEFSPNILRPRNLKIITMAEYEKGLPVEVAFPPLKPTAPLGKILSQHGLKQLRIAETEKYAHVTYFFNVGREKPFVGEDRVLIPSKNSPSYADTPEMSAKEITQQLLTVLDKKDYDFILVNYANPDMVGHTGNLEATIKAVETVDSCLSKLIKKVLKRGGCLIITADHGNAEEVINPKTGERDTEHSTNPVPCWLVTPSNHYSHPKVITPTEPEGMLCDIAPTILDLLAIPKPDCMECQSLLKQFKSQSS